MQFIIDFVPLLAALGAYKLYDIYAATIVLMVLLPLIPIGQKLLNKPVSQVHAWSAVLVLIFGAATLFFRDPRFIMWKPSILYFSAGLVFLASQFISEKPIIQRMLGQAFSLQPAQWRRLNMVWSAFFALLAILNLYVAATYSEATWFRFKVWGITGLMFAFIIVQSFWVAAMAPDGNPPEDQ